VAERSNQQPNAPLDFITPQQVAPNINSEQSLQWLPQRLLGNTNQPLIEFLNTP
jgi:hypothetical protein